MQKFVQAAFWVLGFCRAMGVNAFLVFAASGRVRLWSVSGADVGGV